MFNRSTLWILVVAFGLAGLVSGWLYFERPAAAPPKLTAVQLMDAPRALPAFELQRAGGQRFTPADLKGHWTLIFLGFTHCPDICPTTLATMKPVQAHWNQTYAADQRPRLVFVSVDPNRDTPEVAQRYASAFSADTLAATTDEAHLLEFTQSLSMVFMRNAPEDASKPDQYSVDHSAAMAVINPRGELAGFLKAPFDAAAIQRDFDVLAKAPTP
ncbi:SCO family protein [Lysobacter soyae]|jgi:protein SCO1/2|uniref:SCO family protein n=1 Tax=Lysobacter soyae TaxID=2764185 RepID=A0ABX8WPW8_9GAMM|nr:SCO family protein [Lysobacter sp. CJ11]QYR52059.1 SCO family protein [Lysobacter sp. CJ11]